MQNPFTRTVADPNTPEALASELASARQVYNDTRDGIWTRAYDRVRAMDDIIREAQDEKAAATAVMADAGEYRLEDEPVGLSD